MAEGIFKDYINKLEIDQQVKVYTEYGTFSGVIMEHEHYKDFLKLDTVTIAVKDIVGIETQHTLKGNQAYKLSLN